MTADPVMLTVLGLVAIFVLIALHVPVGVAMGVAGVGGPGHHRSWWPRRCSPRTGRIRVL